MKLGSVFVWFPVLHLRAEATYRLLPELTPLHRALETAVKEFSNSGNALALTPIPKLFGQLFGISGAREILPEVLGDLIERGRVHRVVENGSDLSLLRIVDLASGRSEAVRALGHAQSDTDEKGAQTRTIERFLDVVLGETVRADSLALEPQQGEHHFCVPVEPFLSHRPTYWVEHELKTELPDDVSLCSSPAVELMGYRWRGVTAELVLVEGELSVQCDDPRQSKYLQGLPPAVRRKWLLPNSSDRLPPSSYAEGESLSIHCRLPPELEGLALTRGLPGTVVERLELPATVVLVTLDPADDVSEPTLVSGSAMGRSKQVAYSRKDDPGIAGIFLANEGREYLRLPITWESMHAEIGAFRETRGFRKGAGGLGGVIEALEAECRFSVAPEIFVLPAFWLDPADFWRRLSERAGIGSDEPNWLARIVAEIKALPPSILARLLKSVPVGEPWEHLCSAHPALADLSPSAHAKSIDRALLADELAPVPAFCTRVIAFDSSSLLQYGQLIENLRPTDFLVSPQVVAEEVERNKNKSAEYRIASRRNLRAIGDLPKERWVAPFHDFAALIPGDKRNNDGAIIATLVPYCRLGHAVVVVSEDHDFVLRCRPYGIEWMNSAAFLEGS